MSKYKILYFLIFLSVSITISGQEKNKSTKDTVKATVNAPDQKKQDTIKKSLDDAIKAINDTSKVVVGATNNQIVKDTVNTQDSPSRY